MHLPLVNQFINPHLIYNEREATQEDINTRLINGCHPLMLHDKVKLDVIDSINTPEKAIKYILNGQHTNSIESAIATSLNNKNSNHRDCINMMPSKTPRILSKYQIEYNTRNGKPDMLQVNNAILGNGEILSDNQILFHGGGILKNTQAGSSFTTNRPLSTSFCPYKALLNGMHYGKYYNENEVNIITFTVDKISQPAFVFKINGTNKGHEKEVLIASGATLKVVNKTLIKSNYTVYCCSGSSKIVPAYLVEATIS